LSKEVEVRHLIEERGDIHHIFPKKYLQNNGYNNRGQYNQIANYTYTQQEINIAIKDQAPNKYMQDAMEQCHSRTTKYGEIADIQLLRLNLEENSIPEEIFNMDFSNYEEFLEIRRTLMAQKIKNFYFAL